MKKRIVSIILAVLLVISAMPLMAAAAGETVENYDEDVYIYYGDAGSFFFEVTGTEATIVRSEIWDYPANDVSGVLEIPSSIDLENGTIVEVVEIGDMAFMGCKDLTEVTIPDSVRAIRTMAFQGTGELDYIISSSVDTIESRAFGSGGRSFTVDSGNANYASDAQGLLYNKDFTILIASPLYIESVVIPNTVTSVDEYAFQGVSLETLEILENSFTFADNPFLHASCKNFIVDNLNPDFSVFDGALYHGNTLLKYSGTKTSIDALKTGTDNIARGAFSRGKLQNVTFPTIAGVNEVPYSAFAECKELASVSMPEGITEIEDVAFAGCTNLADVNFPDSLEIIGNHAFSETSLTDVVIGDNVTEIKDEAFAYIRTMENFEISESVTTMGQIFVMTSGDISVHADNPNYYDKDNVVYESATESPVFASTSIKNLEIPDGTTVIPDYIFSSSEIETVDIPDSVTEIGRNAFADCTNLTTIEISENVEEIDASFVGCGADIIVDPANNDFASKDGALYNKAETTLLYAPTARTNIDIPTGVTEIATSAFSVLNKETGNAVKTITMPDTVDTLGLTVFGGCNNLESITLSSSLKKIPSLTFSGCSSLRSLELPAGVEYIGQKAIEGCDSLTSVRKSASSTQRAVALFANRNQDKKVLSSYSFIDCKELSKVEVPDGVTSIEPVAFNNCPKLRTIVIPDTVTEMSKFTFGNLASFTIQGKSGSYAEQFATENNIPFDNGEGSGGGVIPGPGEPEPENMQFTDVVEGSWYYDDVKNVFDKGWMTGTSDDKFNPKGEMTRAMFVTVLYRMDDEPDTSEMELVFGDVGEKAYYADAVKWATENEIVNGTSANTFSPNSEISRQDIATILFRYAKYKEIDLSNDVDLSEFADADQITPYALEAVKWTIKMEIIKGSNGKINPKGNAKRAEVAAMITRMPE